MKPMLMNECDSQLPRVLLTHDPFRSAVVLFITYLLSTSRCGPGFFCSEGTRHKAPVGSYIPNSGVASKKAATPCPGGTFGNFEGMMKPECSGSCTQGYFCPAGSTTPTANDCIRGNEARAGGGCRDEQQQQYTNRCVLPPRRQCTGSSISWVLHTTCGGARFGAQPL